MSGLEVWLRRSRTCRLVRLAGFAAVVALSSLVAAKNLARPGPSAPGGETKLPARPPATPVSPKPGPQPVHSPQAINAHGYTSAMVCGSCHIDIYDSWKKSLHAFSLSDPVFDAAFMLALRDAGDEARRLCLRCHAPLTIANSDFDLREGVTREGVSCDFCHTVVAVHLDNYEKPFVLEPGLVKRSVLRNAASPAHQVAYSQLHETAEFCGACHNYVAPNGARIMTTYDEWRAGPYASEGRPCQDCHMVRRVGHVVSADVKEDSGKQIHLHDLIHDTGQLRSALTAQVLSATRTGDSLAVEVEVENIGSGHMVPTGVPSREVVLTVEVESGRRLATQERRYHKVLVDKDGVVLRRDFEALLRAAAVVTDNRIAPREKRLERFVFVVPDHGTLKVRATLSYEYAPIILDQREINIELVKVERYVP
ncbi:MAG: cytochrome c family protein [Acidobacteriia bacterium]|nr:cytochrome c family protein [Terriglobia bacterium]